VGPVFRRRAVPGLPPPSKKSVRDGPFFPPARVRQTRLRLFFSLLLPCSRTRKGRTAFFPSSSSSFRAEQLLYRPPSSFPFLPSVGAPGRDRAGPRCFARHQPSTAAAPPFFFPLQGTVGADQDAMALLFGTDFPSEPSRSTGTCGLFRDRGHAAWTPLPVAGIIPLFWSLPESGTGGVLLFSFSFFPFPAVPACPEARASISGNAGVRLITRRSPPCLPGVLSPFLTWDRLRKRTALSEDSTPSFPLSLFFSSRGRKVLAQSSLAL